MIAACVCSFHAPRLHPWSVAFHVAHKRWHLATFPASNAGTIASLDRMIESAERRATREGVVTS